MKKLLKVFGITISILLLSFLILRIYPFGDNSIVVIDANTQYITFLSYLKTILNGSNDFKYTFSATLGQNFLPLLGYYLMSLFNILVIFFKPENIKILFTLLIIIKIGLCSVTMEYYLEKKYKKNTWIFSVCYGLMAYNIVYMYHTMWFDSIILLPFVILGIDKIFEDKNPAMYIFALALTIIFNYYIGFIICLTSVLYFIYKYIFELGKIDKFKVIVNYGVSSLLAGALSAFILLPSLLGLMGGKVGSNIELGFNSPYLRVIAKAFTASVGVNETWHGGPMIASSMFVFILTILYFFNKKIKKREKIINGLSILFLMTTFTFKPLCLLFHGLTNPNCFNYRHAFIFVFFIITLAIRSYNKLEINLKNYKYTRYILIILGLVILGCRFKFNTSTYNISIFISVLLGLLYLYFLKNKKNIIYLVLIDVFINTIAGTTMLKMSDKQSMKNYKNYVQDVNESLETIKDDGFYRIEKVFDRETNRSMLAINDSMLFNYNGINHFDSTAPTSTELLLEKLGLRKLLTRTYYDKNSSYLIDSLFGIKYILSYEDYKDYDLISTKNGIKLYENPYFLTLGYKIMNGDVNFTNNPFDNQNNVARSFSALNKDIFISASYTMSLENVKVKNNRYIPQGKGIININVNIEQNDNLYFYIPVNEAVGTNYPNAKIYINDEFYTDYLTKYEWSILNLGKYEKGQNINIKIEFEKELIMDDLYLYYENTNVFEEHYNILKLNEININKITSSNLTCDLNLEENSKIMFTIPYDEGWNILVDGKKVNKEKALDDLILINIEKGSHIIDLKYEPKGLKLGIYISLISLFVSIIYIVLREKIWAIYDKFKEIFNYIIVGVLTTIVSLVSYFIFSRILNIDKTIYFILANTLSWILSVAFAYITNKIFVFESKTKGKAAFTEMLKFVSSRILTYLIDLGLMLVFVKLIHINNDVSKLIVQFVVLVLNYILSKLLVFKK